MKTRSRLEALWGKAELWVVEMPNSRIIVNRLENNQKTHMKEQDCYQTVSKIDV